MPSFPKPAFDFSFSVAKELKILRNYKMTKHGRFIPVSSANNLLIAT
jgi:hypothetical protein